MARKKKVEQAPNHERWLVSYADFITLLFAFFTSMYAISTVDARKAGKMVFSTRAAFNVDFFPSDKTVLGGSSSQSLAPAQPHNKLVTHAPPPRSMIRPLAQRHRSSSKKLQDLAKRLQNTIVAQKLTDEIRIGVKHRGLVISLAAAAFFEPGTAEVKSASLPILDRVIDILVQSHYPLRVEGHTDNQPIHSKRFHSNWELSTARAVSVITYMIEEYAYPPDLLSAAGYASYRPDDTNDTPEGRAHNRRVDLILEDNPAVEVHPTAQTHAIGRAPLGAPAQPAAPSPIAPSLPGQIASPPSDQTP